MKLPKDVERVREDQCPNYVFTGIHGVSVDEMCKSAWKYGFNEGYSEAMKRVAPLVEALEHTKASLSYAYEDHSDQYYINVKNDLLKALQQFNGEDVE